MTIDPSDPSPKELPIEPIAPHANGSILEAPDGTLAGYFREHLRPPAFEGCDGEPYSVSPETEKTPDLRAPYEGFLVFPRWAGDGIGVLGHVESQTLVRGASREDVLAELGAFPLTVVKAILDEAIRDSSLDSTSTPCAD